MVLQILKLCICLGTLLAGIWPVALVIAPVFAVHRGVSKTLATFCTEIRFLSCVGALVNFQLGQRRIALRAVRTRMRPLATVLCHVNAQADGLHKCLATFSTDKGFFSSVGAVVIAQLGVGLVCFMALRALEWTLSRM